MLHGCVSHCCDYPVVQIPSHHPNILKSFHQQLPGDECISNTHSAYQKLYLQVSTKPTWATSYRNTAHCYLVFPSPVENSFSLQCFPSIVPSPEQWYTFCGKTQNVQFCRGNGASTSYSLQTLELIWISLLIHTVSLLSPLCYTCFPFLLKSYNELMTEDFPIHNPCNFFPSQGTA